MIDIPPPVTHRTKDFSTESDAPRAAGTPLAIRITCVVLVLTVAALLAKVTQMSNAAGNLNDQLAVATSTIGQMKVGLAAANERSADLQLQVNTAKGVQADLRTQLDTAKGEGMKTQAMLQKARADLKSQEESAKAQSAEMQAEVGRAQGESSNLRRENVQYRGQFDDLKAQLAKSQDEIARLQPAALKAKVLPIATSFEKGFWDRSFTMKVRNLSPDALNIALKVTGDGRQGIKSATIEGGETLTIRSLSQGTKVEIGSDGYDTLSETVQ